MRHLLRIEQPLLDVLGRLGAELLAAGAGSAEVIGVDLVDEGAIAGKGGSRIAGRRDGDRACRGAARPKLSVLTRRRVVRVAVRPGLG